VSRKAGLAEARVAGEAQDAPTIGGRVEQIVDGPERPLAPDQRVGE
jgi:hypothetical protein